MSGKDIIYNDEKIKRSIFYENKKLSKIDDIDVNKILVSKKKNHVVQKLHLNNSLGIMMVSLDHYVQSFLKSLDIVNAYYYYNKTVSFKATDKNLIKKYIRI